MSKRFTLFILIGFIFSLHLMAADEALKPEDFLSNEGVNTLIPIESYYLKEFQKSPVSKMYYYHRLPGYHLPSNYRNAILYSDASIDIIQDLHTKSYQYWSSKENVDSIKQDFQLAISQYNLSNRHKGSDGNLNIDIQTLANLNNQAYRFWNKLIECNNGSYSVARANFMRPAEGIYKLCEKGTVGTAQDSSPVLLKELKQLAKNFQSFYGGIDIEWLTTAELTSFQEIYRHVFGNLHPILSQLLIQQYSIVAYDNIQETLPKEVRSLGYGISSFFSDRDFKIRLKELNPSLVREENSNTQDKELVIRQLLISTGMISFLNFQNNEFSCGVYGLWPLLNRSLLSQAYPLFSGSPPIFNRLKESEALNCGEIKIRVGDAISTHGPFYANVWMLHRLYSQAAYYNILGVQWDTRTEFEKNLAIKSAGLEPTVEAIDSGTCTVLQHLPIFGQLLQLKDPYGIQGDHVCFH